MADKWIPNLFRKKLFQSSVQEGLPCLCRKLGKVLTFKFQKKRETNLLKEMLCKLIDDYNTNIKITHRS